MARLLVLLSFLAFATLCLSFEWQHPGEHDSRSPCPALNSLANHGILPRDGRNLTVPMLVDAMAAGLNISEELGTSLSKTGLLAANDPKSGKIDLSDLNKHNIVEHDGSLTRKDFALGGEDQKYCEEIFNETLSYYGDATDVGLEEVAAARWGRLQSSKNDNDNFTYGPNQRFGSHFESSAYFLTFQNPETKKARVDWIKTFFSEERLPFNEGWKPLNHIDGLTIAQTVLQISMLTPEEKEAESEE